MVKGYTNRAEREIEVKSYFKNCNLKLQANQVSNSQTYSFNSTFTIIMYN